MDTNAVVASAAIGALVASVTTLVVNQMKKAKNTKEQTLEVVDAGNAGYTRGWFEGRESVLQNFQPATAADFTPVK